MPEDVPCSVGAEGRAAVPVTGVYPVSDWSAAGSGLAS